MNFRYLMMWYSHLPQQNRYVQDFQVLFSIQQEWKCLFIHCYFKFMPLLFSTTWMICLIILIQWSAWLLLFTICAALFGFPWLQWWLLCCMHVYITVSFTNDLFTFYTLIYIDYIFFSKYISSEMWLSSHTQACGFFATNL